MLLDTAPVIVNSLDSPLDSVGSTAKSALKTEAGSKLADPDLVLLAPIA